MDRVGRQSGAVSAGEAQGALRPVPDTPPVAAGPEGSGGRGPARLARWGPLTSPVAGHLALLIGYLAAGVIVTWPRASYLAGRLPESRDSAAYVWGFWWIARQVSHLADPWFTHLMAAPSGVALGYHALMPLPGLLLTPVTLLFGPSASYNLLVTLMPGLLCYAMYRAARLWLRSQVGAIAAGAFFGLSAMLTQQDWYHLNIVAGALFLPLALEASVRLRRTPGLRQAVLLGVVVAAELLTDPELTVLAGILIAVTLLPWLIFQPSVRKLRAVVIAAVIGVILASPQLIAMAREASGVRISARLLGVTDNHYGIGLPGMFAPTPRVADFGLVSWAAPFWHSRDNEAMPMFGVTLTVLALAGLAVAWRRRQAWQLAALWLGCALLALGTTLWVGKIQYIPLMQFWHGVRVSQLLPFTWFTRIPALSSFREADRFAILGLVPACLLAGAAVDWLRYHAWPLIVVVAAVAVVELGYSGNPHVGEMPTALPAVDARIAADHSDRTVVDVPYGLRGGIPEYGGRFAAEALVLATADGHPRAIAYVSRLPQPTIDAARQHAFYSHLIHVQHYSPPARTAPLPWVAPWSLPLWAAKSPLIPR